jgi:hypothetical protein
MLFPFMLLLSGCSDSMAMGVDRVCAIVFMDAEAAAARASKQVRAVGGLEPRCGAMSWNWRSSATLAGN